VNVKKLVLSIVMVLFTSVLLAACTVTEIAEDKVSQSSAESSEATSVPTTAPTLEPTPTPKHIAEETKLENGLTIVKYNDETYGVLNDKGKSIYEDLTAAKDLENGFVAVERGKLTGFTDGKVNTEIKYNKYGSYPEGILAGDEETKTTDILVKGEEIISQKGVYVDSRKGTDDIIYEIREVREIQDVFMYSDLIEKSRSLNSELMRGDGGYNTWKFINKDINDVTLFGYERGRNIEDVDDITNQFIQETLYNPMKRFIKSGAQIFAKVYESEEDMVGSYGYISYLAIRVPTDFNEIGYYQAYRPINDDCTYVRGERDQFPQWEEAVFFMNQEQGTSFDYTPKIVFDYETEEFVEITEENKHLLVSEQMKRIINE